MKHMVFFVVCLAAFVVSAIFMFKWFYHGAVDPVVFHEKESIEKNITDVVREKLYPGGDSATLFGRTSFGRAHPGLEKALSAQEVFNTSEDVSKGWKFQSNEDNTDIARIYWNDRVKWSSGWRHLAGDKYVKGDRIQKVGGKDARDILTDEKVSQRLPVFSGSEEIIFGKNAFRETFPDLERVSRVENMATPPDKLSRGWIVKDEDDDETQYARVYWDDTAYWVSGWKHLRGDTYVESGTLWEPQREWDGSIDGNHWIMVGIMFGLLLGAVILFFFLEAVFVEFY